MIIALRYIKHEHAYGNLLLLNVIENGFVWYKILSKAIKGINTHFT